MLVSILGPHLLSKCLYLAITGSNIPRKLLRFAIYLLLPIIITYLYVCSVPSVLNRPVFIANSMVAFTAAKSGLHAVGSPSTNFPLGSFRPDYPPRRCDISPHRLLSLTDVLSSCLSAFHTLQSSRTCFTVSFSPHSHISNSSAPIP